MSQAEKAQQTSVCSQSWMLRAQGSTEAARVLWSPWQQSFPFHPLGRGPWMGTRMTEDLPQLLQTEIQLSPAPAGHHSLLSG